MFRKTSSIVLAVPLALAMSVPLAAPALAAAPSDGVVVEGESVPGIALGDSRTQVQVAYGAPAFCQSVDAGDMALCTFDVEGGGQVAVRYRGPDGGNASNSPDDIVSSIRWYEQVSGWTTTAGINTTVATNDPQAVVDAYPTARVTYTLWGDVYSVIDYVGGIEILRIPNFYSGTVHVQMGIFNPRPAPPVQESLTVVADIDLTSLKAKGDRQVRAFVKVEKETTFAASGATVTATWAAPDGSMATTEAVTSGSGYAYFEVNDARRGTYTLSIEDVVLAGHRFDSENSLLSASIRVK